MTAALVAACAAPAGETIDATPIDGAASCTGIPNSPAGLKLQWILDRINGDIDGLMATDYSANVTPTMENGVSLAAFKAALQVVADTGTPVRYAGMLRQRDDVQVSPLLIGDSGKAWGLRLTVEAATPNRLENIELATSDAASFVSVLDTFTTPPSTHAGMLVARVQAGQCSALFEYNSQSRRAVASVFKLYVLGALADEIRQGNLAWAQPVAVQDELKTMGQTAGESAGTELTLAELAKRMIQQSDNTATDHVMFAVGRETIEAFLPSMGHLAPSVNIPFLTARDAVVFKYMDPSLGAQYCASTNVAQRRGLLVQSAATPIIEANLPTENNLPPPTYIDCVEWFASPEELCAALASLVDMASEPGLSELRGILTPAPVVADILDAETFPTLGFKPGSEPGVLANAWYLERCDGQAYAVTAAYNDATAALSSPPDTTAMGVFMTLAQP